MKNNVMIVFDKLKAPRQSASFCLATTMVTKSVMTVLLCLMVWGTDYAYAQKDGKERTVAIWGHIRDSFTKNGIENVKVTIMNADSTVVDTMRVWGASTQGVTLDTYYRFVVPAKPQKFIIKAEHPYYEDTYVDFDMKYIRRNKYFDAPWHYMRRKQKRDEVYAMGEELDEVVVTATKVRIAYRGDTLVYNADAFNVPNGSMLDGLLKQMDGVKLNSKTGEITVNGRKVDYLTLNGKDFFKGKNKVMLENLPYYTVKEIKVFDKRTDLSELAGRDLEQKDYVMDVQLKREYSLGYLGHAEAAGGLSVDNDNGKTKADRYLGRLFGLVMGEKTRITLLGNINNINRSGGVSSDGDWNDRISQEGEYTYRHAGLNVNYNGKDNTISNELGAEARWNDSETIANSSEENYLTTGSTFAKAGSVQNAKSKSINISDVFKIRRPQDKLPINHTTSLYFNRSASDHRKRGSDYTFASNPFGEGTAVADSVNSSHVRHLFDNSSTEMYINNNFNVKLPWGDIVSLTLNGSMAETGNDRYNLNQYRYHRQEEKNETQNRYANLSSNSFSYYAFADYTINWLSGWSLTTGAASDYKYRNETTDYYMLEQLGDRYADMGIDNWHIMLPSTTDSLLMCRDAYNSYRYISAVRKNKVFLSPSYTKQAKGEYTYLYASLNMNWENRSLRYHSIQFDGKERNSHRYISTKASLYRSYDSNNKTIQAVLEMKKSAPNLLDMLSITDDSNPLSIYTGNPNLKMSTEYSWYSRYYIRKPKKKDFFAYANLDARLSENAIRQGYTYDTKTGVRTYCAQNVNGIWNAGIALGTGSAIDSAKCLRYDIAVNYRISHDAEYAGINNSFGKNTTTTQFCSVQPSLKYQRGKLSLNTSGVVSWSNNHRKNVLSAAADDINIYNYRFSLSGTYELPWQLQVSSTFEMMFNRGYESDYLDTDRMMWNMSLSRPFMKGRLLARIVANDILGQYSNHSISLSSSGYSERWTNGLGRYVMLSLAYKFNKMKKK